MPSATRMAVRLNPVSLKFEPLKRQWIGLPIICGCYRSGTAVIIETCDDLHACRDVVA